MALLIVAGFMLFVTFFGKQFGESIGGIGEGVSKLLSPQIKPAIIPTIGLEFTPGVWEWWRSASAWFEQGGFAQGIREGIVPPAGNGDNLAGGDNGEGLGGITVFTPSDILARLIASGILKAR